jgi:flagellar motor component MotA
MVAALDTDQAQTIGLIALVTIVLIGVLLALIVRRVVSKIIVLVLAAALAVFVWTQRSSISSAAKKCDARFLGIHLTIKDDTLRQQCQNLTNQ